jgi:hypothetical protein
MKILTVALILAFVAVSQGDLFEDDFNDGNADGWYEWPTPGTYDASNYYYKMSYSGPEDTFCLALRGDVDSVTMSSSDYSVSVELTTYSPTETSGVDVRFNIADSTCYAAYLNWGAGTCYIGRYDAFYDFTSLGWVYVPGGLV